MTIQAKELLTAQQAREVQTPEKAYETKGTLVKRKEQDKGDTRGLHVRTQVEPGHWEQSSPNNPKKVSVAARGVKHTHSLTPRPSQDPTAE